MNLHARIALLPMTLALALALPAIAQSASGLGPPNYKLTCNLTSCGTASNAPRTSLLKVNPEPLPSVKQDAPQDITVEWSVRFGLPANYELCVTTDLVSGPQNTDPCTFLAGSTVINSGLGGTTYEDVLTLPSGPSGFYRPTANFYIRTTSIIHFGNPSNSWSNRLAFVWPLLMPNLFAHNPKPRQQGGGVVEIEHRVSNFGQLDAGASETRFVVAVCDGNANLPLVDPEDPESDRLCAEGVDGYIENFEVRQQVGSIPAGANLTTFTPITNELASGLSVASTLWLGVTAYVDDQDAVTESNEQDNVRYEDRIVMP